MELGSSFREFAVLDNQTRSALDGVGHVVFANEEGTVKICKGDLGERVVYAHDIKKGNHNKAKDNPRDLIGGRGEIVKLAHGSGKIVVAYNDIIKVYDGHKKKRLFSGKAPLRMKQNSENFWGRILSLLWASGMWWLLWAMNVLCGMIIMSV